MISIAWAAALRLFASAWAKFLFVSGKLSPANWDRVVLICLGLLLASLFGLMRVTGTHEEGVRTESTDTRLPLELKRVSQLQDLTNLRSESSTSWKTRNRQDQVDLLTTTEPSARSMLKRAERRASTTRYRRSHRINDKEKPLIGNLRHDRSGSPVPTAAEDADRGNPSAEPAAELVLKDKVTTAGEAVINTSPISNSALARPKSPLEPVKSDAKLVHAKPETDTEDCDSLAINYDPGGIGKNVYANRIGVGPMGSCDDCKFEEFFLSAWSIGNPAILVDQPANSAVLPAFTTSLGAPPVPTNPPSTTEPKTCTRVQLGDTGAPADPNCAKARMPMPGAVDSFPYQPAPLLKTLEAYYPDDPSNGNHSVKFRIHHDGPVASHVYHLHAHQWLQTPDDDNSTYLDSQAVGPGFAFTTEIVHGGSGNRNQVVGDSIFHCHFYPHFAEGMWELWRLHDVFEAGTVLNANGIPVAGARALPDGKITAGTLTPALVPEAISAADQGTMSVNYRNEPVPLRVRDPNTNTQASGAAGDLSKVYKSNITRADPQFNVQPTFYPALTQGVQPGDPFTPLLRAYENDKVQIRILVGAHEETHNLTINGHKWLHEPSTPQDPLAVNNSGYRNSQMAGISEHFEFLTGKESIMGGRSFIDYLYQNSASVDGQWNGVWGILRVYNGRNGLKTDLYFRSEDIDGYCNVKAGVPIEPLVVRARAGECIRLPKLLPDLDGFNTMANLLFHFNANQVRPSNQVGLHPQLLAYNVANSDGKNVGFNPNQTVEPGGVARYRWYAGDVVINGNQRIATPIEFGATNLISSDPIKHSNKRAIGSLIIEPAGSSWIEVAGSRAQATITLTYDTFVIQRQPSQEGAFTGKTDGDKLKIEPKGRDQQSSASVMDVPKEWPKTLLATPNDKNVTILFWVFLFSTLVNGLSTTSAIVLAWMSNNRAKAELILKQADALREAKERELRIRELELRIAQFERDASGSSKLIIVGS
jgi:hypothetical protein